MSLCVAETIVGSLMFGGVGNVQCLFNLLYYVIWFVTPRNYSKGVNHLEPVYMKVGGPR